MTIHRVNGRIPNNLAPSRFTKNGQQPSAPYWYQVAKGVNHSAELQKKLAFLRSEYSATPKAGASGDNDRYRFFFHSGYGGNGRLVVMIGMAPCDNVAATNPGVRVGVKPVGSSEVWSEELNYNAYHAGTYLSANHIFHGKIVCDISAATSYEVRIQARDYARMIYAMAYEEPSMAADDTETGLCDPSAFVVQAPIEDAPIQKVIDAANAQWKRNGAHLLSWCDKDLNGAGTASTTFVNRIDGGSTVTATSAGWKIDKTYKNRLSETVPVMFAVYAKMTSGSYDGKVRLTDGTNYIECNVTGTSYAWHTVTGNLPAALAKYDLHWRSTNALSTISMEAAALLTYKA